MHGIAVAIVYLTVKGDTQVVVVDLSGVALAGEAMPSGLYTCVLDKFEFREARSSGKPMVVLTGTITGDDNETPGVIGRKVWPQHSFDVKSLPFLKRSLVNLGVDPSDLEGKIDLKVILQDIVGEEFYCKVGQRDYEGRMQNTFDIVSPPSGWPER